MIIETSSNVFYRVTETGDADLAHVWYGIEVRRDRKTGEWKQKARISHPRPQLVRKAGTRFVESV